jgi:hypothetical protein
MQSKDTTEVIGTLLLGHSHLKDRLQRNQMRWLIPATIVQINRYEQPCTPSTFNTTLWKPLWQSRLLTQLNRQLSKRANLGWYLAVSSTDKSAPWLPRQNRGFMAMVMSIALSTWEIEFNTSIQVLRGLQIQTLDSFLQPLLIFREVKNTHDRHEAAHQKVKTHNEGEQKH